MRFLVILAFMFTAAFHEALSQVESRTFLALIVANRDSSIHWYQEFLSLQLTDSTSFPERSLKMANLMNEQFHVELIELGNSFNPNDQNNPIQGIFKVGRVIEGFQQMHDGLKRKGANFRSEIFSDEKTGLRSFIILDPDGNRIQFFGK